MEYKKAYNIIVIKQIKYKGVYKMINEKPMPDEIFGENVFDDRVMRQHLPKDTYKSLKKCIDQGLLLDPQLAEVVANAMKDWALAKGATHYTHWFQPLNSSAAVKHESFISPLNDGGAIMEFSGKMLIMGEPDASSFPSGGLRATFEARGYTMWDPTSPAFVKEDGSGVTLYIPTAFCSWGGHSLDEKTPLLRSTKALSKHAIRILHIFGDHETKKVNTSVGAEQEYFLIAREQFKKRKDLVLSGRTLFGARPSKTQELSDHYFAGLSDKVGRFMCDIDMELWKMGVSAKTKHNEVAPCQHELAPIFSAENISADQNQLIMETLVRVALQHDLICLLHEKPFEYINGSGKHNNWSICTDTGTNLLEPGENPYDNAKFLLFVSAVIRAIDLNAGLLRATTASSSNDHRLGGFEAPPAVISICLGEPLCKVFENVASGITHGDENKNKLMDLGVPTLPQLYADSSDRNRTSPFAFTGNKFEFRMLGSSMTISWVNTVLNTIVADVLDEFATRLENCSSFDNEIASIVSEVYKEHNRIIFNGNGYSEEWAQEAMRRGLPSLATTPDAAPELTTDNAVAVFENHGVCSKDELFARYEIMLDLYKKKLLIEARTMAEMAKQEIYPSVTAAMDSYIERVGKLEALGLSTAMQRTKLAQISSLADELELNTNSLEDITALAAAKGISIKEQANICKESLIPAMQALRSTVDALESIMPKENWPMPTYYDILFNSR